MTSAECAPQQHIADLCNHQELAFLSFCHYLLHTNLLT